MDNGGRTDKRILVYGLPGHFHPGVNGARDIATVVRNYVSIVALFGASLMRLSPHTAKKKKFEPKW